VLQGTHYAYHIFVIENQEASEQAFR